MMYASALRLSSPGGRWWARFLSSTSSAADVIPKRIRKWHASDVPLPALCKSFVDAPIIRSVIEDGGYEPWGDKWLVGKEFCEILNDRQLYDAARAGYRALLLLFYWTMDFLPVMDGICTTADYLVPHEVTSGRKYKATTLLVTKEPVLVMMPQVPGMTRDALLRTCIDATKQRKEGKQEGNRQLASDPNHVWSMLVAVAGPESVTFQLVEFDQSLLRPSTIDTEASIASDTCNIVTYKPSAAASCDGALSYFNRDSRLAIGQLLADVAAATEGRVDEWVARPKPKARSRKNLQQQ